VVVVVVVIVVVVIVVVAGEGEGWLVKGGRLMFPRLSHWLAGGGSVKSLLISKLLSFSCDTFSCCKH
jgi:hypothetical protein